MTIKAVTLGCKVNQCESAAIVEELTKCGFNASEGLEPADVYILNSCSVTAEADKKSRQYIAKMRKLNPECKIIVLGCSSQNAPSKFKKSNVISIGGTENKVNYVVNVIKQLSNSILSDRVLYQKPTNGPVHMGKRTRTFIKIQDGCDRFCNYCIIPYLRGRCKSESIDNIIAQCNRCESKEIVLTGIDISSYGKDTGSSLTELVRALGEVKGVRKRLGSLECEVIDEHLLEAMTAYEFCPHFHLSLQSGSDSVLASMNRHYTTEYYKQKVDLIRSFFPLAAITTDIIVGYPTETDEQFELSTRFIENCRFSDIHVFPYSMRMGTVASKKYRFAIPSDIMDSRIEKLTEIKYTAKRDFIEKNIGMDLEVYAEEPENEGIFSVGYTPNYIKVYSHLSPGQIKNLKIIKPYKDGAIGE